MANGRLRRRKWERNCRPGLPGECAVAIKSIMCINECCGRGRQLINGSFYIVLIMIVCGRTFSSPLATALMTTFWIAAERKGWTGCIYKCVRSNNYRMPASRTGQSFCYSICFCCANRIHSNNYDCDWAWPIIIWAASESRPNRKWESALVGVRRSTMASEFAYIIIFNREHSQCARMPYNFIQPLRFRARFHFSFNSGTELSTIAKKPRAASTTNHNLSTIKNSQITELHVCSLCRPHARDHINSGQCNCIQSQLSIIRTATFDD